MDDQYAGLVMPNPPKGYRLARWDEPCKAAGYKDAALFFATESKTWMRMEKQIRAKFDYNPTMVEDCIYAIKESRQ